MERDAAHGERAGDPLGDAGTRWRGPTTNAFPTAAAMARAPERFYREEVRAGYRGAYLIELARRVADGEVDLEAWAASPTRDLPDDELERDAGRASRRGPVRSRAHHDDHGQELSAHPGFLDAADLREAGRPVDRWPTRPSHAGSAGTAITRGLRSGCS